MNARAGAIPQVRSATLSDTGNAEMFAAMFGDNVRYDCARRRWLVWSGHHWRPDVDAETMRLTKRVIARRWREAVQLSGDDRDLALAWARRSEQVERRRAMLAAAATERPIADDGGGWDADPFLLGVPNGVVELRTGTLRAGRQSDRITKQCGVRFDAEAKAPRWERFVQEIVGGDAGLAGFLHRACGYTLTGDTTEQAAILLHGDGANGKSTLLELLRHVLGDYALVAPFAMFERTERSASAASSDLASLVGRRFVATSETRIGRTFDEQRVKAIVGGEVMTARFLYSEHITFAPQAKVWLAFNHRPRVDDDSHGFWRRVREVPLTQRFSVDPDLLPALKAEAPGILAWCVRGCLLWRDERLGSAAAIDSATADYRAEQDAIGVFVDECLVTEPGGEVSPTELFAAYSRWCDHAGIPARERLTSTAFGARAKRVLKFDRNGRRRAYLDVRVTGFSPANDGL